MLRSIPVCPLLHDHVCARAFPHSDGGGIYTNGATSAAHPSLIAYNYVNNDDDTTAVYYIDNGTLSCALCCYVMRILLS